MSNTLLIRIQYLYNTGMLLHLIDCLREWINISTFYRQDALIRQETCKFIQLIVTPYFHSCWLTEYCGLTHIQHDIFLTAYLIIAQHVQLLEHMSALLQSFLISLLHPI